MSAYNRKRFNFSVVNVFISLNTLVFLWWTAAITGYADLDYMTQNFLVSWDSLANENYVTLLTAVFSHNMFLHFFMNMFVLKSFGPVLETLMGSRNFLIFYLLAGVISSLSHALTSNFLMHQPELQALGASGSISGLILLFSLLFPRQIILIFGLIPLPAAIGALAFIGLDVWGLIEQATGHGLPIGHGAHLGGAITGILYFLMKRKELKWRLRYINLF